MIGLRTATTCADAARPACRARRATCRTKTTRRGCRPASSPTKTWTNDAMPSSILDNLDHWRGRDKAARLAANQLRCEAMTKRPKRAKAKTARRRKSRAARPRTFEEVRAANLKDPFHAARIARVWTAGVKHSTAFRI
jgi:hypothetical protein